MSEIELKHLKKYIKNKSTYLIFGNSHLDQYSSIKELNNNIKTISKDFDNNSIIFYFGDIPDKENPNIGFIISQIKSRRNDIEIICIGLDDYDDTFINKNIEYPIWIDKFLWISCKTNKKRGVNNNSNKPLGLTKIWYELNKIQPFKSIYLFGGDNITLEEYYFAKELNINIIYLPLKRKYLGDGTTLIKKKHSDEQKIGPTFILNT